MLSAFFFSPRENDCLWYVGWISGQVSQGRCHWSQTKWSTNEFVLGCTMWHVKCKWRFESACLCLLNLLQADQLWSKIIMLMCTPFLKTKIWKRIFKMVPSTGTLLRPWPNNFVYLIIYTGILLNAKQFWLTEKKMTQWLTAMWNSTSW